MSDNEISWIENFEKKKPPVNSKLKTRTLIGFWLLGLCNNYGYVVMLSAAHDILGNDSHESEAVHVSNSTARECNTQSTGAILLADIVPSLFIKLTAPFFPLLINFRMVLTLFLSGAGFILVGCAPEKWVAILGVVSTALSSGLGETSLLSYMSLYKSKNVISTWSSGTGAAGFFGAFTYAGLISIGLSRSATLYILLIIPALMALSFWLLLEHPKEQPKNNVNGDGEINFSGEPPINGNEESTGEGEAFPLTAEVYSLKEKLKFIPSLLKYMVPFGLVYLFEYFINQGLFELVSFDMNWMSKPSQYRWYQVDYQIGVFVSRSSINLFTIKKTWIFALLQGLNVIIFLTEAVYTYLPNIFIIFALIFWEGLLGGASYVNTYYRILNEVTPEKRTFAMSITSLSDALGISIAGFLAMPVHNYICSLPPYN